MPNSDLKISRRLEYKLKLREIRRSPFRKEQEIGYEFTNGKPDRPEKAFKHLLRNLIGLGFVSRRVSPGEKLEQEIKWYLDGIAYYLRERYAKNRKPKHANN